MDNNLKIIVPEEFIENSKLKLHNFVNYLQTEGSTINFEFEKEYEDKKNFKNWLKDIINITKEYLY